METPNIYKVVLADLVADKLKLEEELQRIVNDGSVETTTKVSTLKSILSSINNINGQVDLWNNYMGVGQNNDEVKNQDNGKT